MRLHIWQSRKWWDNRVIDNNYWNHNIYSLRNTFQYTSVHSYGAIYFRGFESGAMNVEGGGHEFGSEAMRSIVGSYYLVVGPMILMMWPWI